VPFVREGVVHEPKHRESPVKQAAHVPRAADKTVRCFCAESRKRRGIHAWGSDKPGGSSSELISRYELITLRLIERAAVRRKLDSRRSRYAIEPISTVQRGEIEVESVNGWSLPLVHFQPANALGRTRDWQNLPAFTEKERERERREGERLSKTYERKIPCLPLICGYRHRLDIACRTEKQRYAPFLRLGRGRAASRGHLEAISHELVYCMRYISWYIRKVSWREVERYRYAFVRAYLWPARECEHASYNHPSCILFQGSIISTRCG